MKTILNRTIIGLFLMLLSVGFLSAQQYSELWGRDGELWNPGSPLNDFSNVAGYRGGNVPLPNRKVRVSIKDFGGVGDGKADDTKALVDAIKACPAQGAIFIPNGTYKITDWIKIRNLKNITILGEDMYNTKLLFPKGLEDYHPKPTRTTGNKQTTEYSWSGGFFWFDNAEELGIENLSFIFPDSPWIEHFKIRGNNVMQISGKNNWVKNVRGYNADNGFFIRGSYMTFKNILLDAYADRGIKSRSIVKGNRAGHHAMDIQGGDHNLIENYEETVKFIHSLGSEGDATWNVWNNCKGPNVEIDHHSSGIGNNLFTDIDMGIGLGSEGQRSINTNGQQETYWNLRSSRILPYDASGAGIKQGIPTIPRSKKTIIVGWWLDWPNSEKNKRSVSFPWYEHIGKHDDIYPKNIYIAQVKRRLKVKNLVPELEITSPVTTSLVKATSVTIAAVANDRDGEIVKADLYLNGEFVKSELQAPYTWTVPLTESNSYNVRIVATDNDGGTSTDTITFTSDSTLTENGETIVFTDFNNPGDICSIVPYINKNEESWDNVSSMSAAIGDDIHFGPQSDQYGANGGEWSWERPDGSTANGRGLIVTNITSKDAGVYKVTNTDQGGCTSSLEFTLNVQEDPGAPGRDMDIYLLIGQSNMGGRAPITAAEEGEIPGVFVLKGKDDWVNAKNPINVYSTIQGGAINKMNPGYTFSIEMRKKFPDKKIGLVSNARGATGLSQWMPGTNYYNEAVKRARLAMEYGTIKGILWHQGEQDTKNPDNIPLYLERIKTMIEALRKDLGAPNLPFVAGEISTVPNSYRAFNEMIQDFPGILPNTALADSDGLTTLDNVHFDTRGMKILGERYADKMYGLLTNDTDDCSIIPFINHNNDGWNSVTSVKAEVGDEVWFGPQSDEFGADGGNWTWTGPNGFTFTGRSLRLRNIQSKDAGAYVATNRDQNGCTARGTMTITINGSSVVGTYYLKNVKTGRYLDADPDALVKQGRSFGGADTRWNIAVSTDGYYFLDNDMEDRGPLAAKPSAGNPIIYLADKYNNTAYRNREWKAILVKGNVYKFLCKDENRGYISAVGNDEVRNLTNGEDITAHWELIPGDTKNPEANEAGLLVSPVPNDGVFTIDFANTAMVNVSIYAITGLKVYDKYFGIEGSSESLSIHEKLSSGMYMIKAVGADGRSYSTKLIIR